MYGLKEQSHTEFHVMLFLSLFSSIKQCIIKELLGLVLVISRTIKVSVSVISCSRWLRWLTLTSTLIILDITNTKSNNIVFKIDPGDHDRWNLWVNHTLIRYMYAEWILFFSLIAKVNCANILFPFWKLQK